ncbi:hypothetical protein CKM354_000162400 [Cercospora kikuchii]|uniref:Uncharacterized protein n=1 Tax=Cercospora kikuchii TaxID=84275 RepID=A0A9P3C8L8_9PEZI|nr:uncharacterized protein CKM354_000162400 [Cercospora kikuchii]GIZ38201.1 hypothetical protein CKM354_000162400 [Cercospora kikuchii]
MQVNMILAALFAGTVAADSATINFDAAITNGATVVYSTRVQTVFSCGPDVTDCPTLTSVIDKTTTICPVTASLGSSTEATTLSSSGSTVTVTKTAAVSSTAVSSTAASSTAAPSTAPPKVPVPLHTTLGSPETTSAVATTTVVKYTSFVFSTVTAPANFSSTVSGSTISANSTIAHTTVSGNIGAPTSSLNGTLSTATAPGTVPSQSIVPYTGAAAEASSSLVLVLVAVAAAFRI